MTTKDDLPFRRRRNRPRSAAALALLALLVALLAARVVTVSRARNIARDGCVYLQMARDFSTMPAGEVTRSYEYHPAYSAVIAAGGDLLGMNWPHGWVQVGRGVSIGFSLVGLLAVYLVARRAFDARIAWVSVLIAALSSTFMEVSCDVISDAMAVSLAAMGIALGLEARHAIRRGSAWSLALSGGAALTSAGAYLTRPEGLLAAGIAAALLLGIPTAASRRSTRKLQLASLGILVGLTVACCLPYMVAVGGLTMKKGFSDFIAGSAGSLPLATATVSADLLSALRRAVDRLRAATGTPMAVLCIACLATWVGRYWLRLKLPQRVVITPREGSAMLAVFGPLTVLFPLLVALEFSLGSPEDGYISSRHMLLAALLLSPLAGAAVAILVQWSLHLGRRAGLVERPRLAWICWTLGVTCLLAIRAFPVLHADKQVHVRTGQAIAEQFGPGCRVLASNAWVPFFAQADRRQFLQVGGVQSVLRPRHIKDRAALETLLEGCRTDAPTLIAVTTNLLESSARPDRTLARLRGDPNLELLRSFRASDGDRIWLFRWRTPSATETQPSRP